MSHTCSSEQPGSPTTTTASGGASILTGAPPLTASPPPTETPLPTAVPLPTREAIETFSNLCRPTPPESYRLTADIAYVVIPFCLVWFPQPRAVDGYRVQVRFGPKTETFTYDVGPGVTEFIFPQEAQPHLADPARCRERELADLSLFARHDGSLDFVDGVGPNFNCYCLAAEQQAVAQGGGSLACTAR